MACVQLLLVSTPGIERRIKYGIVYDSRITLVADRTAGNLLEQFSLFLDST